MLDFKQGEWTGFAFLQALAEYKGGALVDATVRDLRPQLEQLALLRGSIIELDVAELSPGAWGAGLAPSAAMVMQDDAQPALAAETRHDRGRETPSTTEKQVYGWYNSDDLRSWTRALRVAQGSLWNEHARRLRTLLIRMVARGYIGRKTVAADELWDSLPEPHHSAMRENVARLRNEQLLIGDDQQVALNPELLAEIQSLINRDVTPWWARIVGSATSAA